MPRFEALTSRRGGRSVPRCRARTPGKGGPFPRCHYGLRRSRGASRGSAVAETLAGDTQLSRGMPARKRHARGNTLLGRITLKRHPGAPWGRETLCAPAQVLPWEVRDVIWRFARFCWGRARYHSRNTGRKYVKFLLGTRDTPSTRQQPGRVRRRHMARDTTRE